MQNYVSLNFFAYIVNILLHLWLNWGNSYLMKLGQKIRQLRKAAGLTQAELGAKVFNVSDAAGQSHINRIEHGIRQVTDAELNTIKEVLGVDSSEFMGITGSYDYLKLVDIADTVFEAYPEMGSLSRLLTFAIRQKDDYLLQQAWKAVHDFAEKQLNATLDS